MADEKEPPYHIKALPAFWASELLLAFFKLTFLLPGFGKLSHHFGLMPKVLTASHDQFVVNLHKPDIDPQHIVHSMICLLLETAVRQAWLRIVNDLGTWAVIPPTFNISSTPLQIVASRH